ncbi:MAG: heme exporter protein CcmB [Proteobacteria bacterium]|nr:heme exporter protein CcmB [Pseudomonadota bacterium]
MISLLKRDLLVASRSGGALTLSISFFLIMIVLVPFGVGEDPLILGAIATGIIWVAALLSCLLTLDRVFQLDFEDGTLELLATAPVPIEAAALVKAFSHWLTTGLPIIIVSPGLGLLLNLPEGGMMWLIISLTIGTPALSIIGSFGAALTVGLKRGGLLLSLLVLPLYIPTLIFGAAVVNRGLLGLSVAAPLIFLTAVSALSVALLPLATLKINLK